MKRIKKFFGFVIAIFIALPAMAYDLGDIRVNARFLTDRMAFELNLTQRQYNDLYEINYDFFNNINPYADGLRRADARAMDAYYRYLDERNDDMRWILSNSVYIKFMSIDYFFRPIYAMNNVCYIRIYKIYPNRNFFYFGLPVHYATYRGAHCRHRCGGVSYYKKYYKKHYNHKVYVGRFECRPEHRPHDFGPAHRPAKPVPPAIRPQRPPKGEHRPHYQDRDDKKFNRQPRNERKAERNDRKRIEDRKAGSSRVGRDAERGRERRSERNL